eukprot:scaffold23107_cov28-Tisochrysis_lutea.AAC.5
MDASPRPQRTERELAELIGGSRRVAERGLEQVEGGAGGCPRLGARRRARLRHDRVQLHLAFPHRPWPVLLPRPASRRAVPATARQCPAEFHSPLWTRRRGRRLQQCQRPLRPP